MSQDPIHLGSPRLTERTFADLLFRMNGKSGDDTGSFEVKIRTNTARFANMIIARFRESRCLVRESEVFIKDKIKVASRVSSNQ